MARQVHIVKCKPHEINKCVDWYRALVSNTRDNPRTEVDVDLYVGNKRIWWHRRQRPWVHEAINDRVELIEALKEYAVDGKVWMQEYGRDCDMCESTTDPFQINTTVYEWERRRYYMRRDAEGPVRMWMLTAEQAAEAKGSFHDLAMEAFEDGHPHVVYPHGCYQGDEYV